MEPIMVKEKVQVPVAVVLAALSIGLSFFAIFYSGQSTPQVKSGEIKMAAAAATYYVDCGATVNGNGTSQESPYNNLTSLSTSIPAGSQVYIKKGSVCAKQKLFISSSGQAGNYIVFSSYPESSTDSDPIIDGQNASSVDFGVQIKNANYVAVKNIIIRNIASSGFTGTASGVGIEGSSNITLDNVRVENSYGSAGIFILFNDGQGGYLINNVKVSNMKGSAAHPYNAGGGAGIVIEPMAQPLEGNTFSSANNIISNSVASSSEGSGIGLYNVVSSKVQGSYSFNNGGAGIHLGGKMSNNNIIEKNFCYQNTQKIDDVFGIDLLQVGDNNIVRYNTVHDQHDTLNDPQAIPNPGNGDSTKFGTGGIRFDGGIPNSTTWNSNGNQAYYNIIYNEYYGMDILNFNNVKLSNNVIYNSANSGIYLGAYNNAYKGFANTEIKNNIIHTAPFMIRYAVRVNDTLDGSPASFNNNIYYNSGGANFAWQIFEYGYTQSLTFEEWMNNNSAVSGWTQFADGANKFNVWYVVKAKNPAVVYVNGLKITRSTSAEPLEDLKQAGCANKWAWIPAGSVSYLALCSTAAPSNVVVYNSEIATGSESGSKVADPKFVGASSKDFHLGSASPAINTGINLGFTQDIGGAPVPYDGTPDIGAYEYGAKAVCLENWSCGTWGTCTAGSQTRTCTDANNCGTTASKPVTSQTCTTAVVCGDGVIGGTEQCDGTNLNAQTCATKGFTGGTLKCTSCLFDTSACTSSTCSNTCTGYFTYFGTKYYYTSCITAGKCCVKYKNIFGKTITKCK